MISEISSLNRLPEVSVDDCVILDVRSPEEYALYRLPGAINIDIMSNGSIEKLSMLDKETPYIVYCTVGVRSRSAVRLMDQMGFSRIFHLTDGIVSYTGKLEKTV